MTDRNMGRRCIYSGQCHIYQGVVKFKHPLFLIKNIYCNNGFRWFSKCAVYKRFNAGESVTQDMLPDEDLRLA